MEISFNAVASVLKISGETAVEWKETFLSGILNLQVSFPRTCGGDPNRDGWGQGGACFSSPLRGFPAFAGGIFSAPYLK